MIYREWGNSMCVEMRFLMYIKHKNSGANELEKTSIGGCCYDLCFYIQSRTKSISKYSC